jgi:4-carboxymuconolactone decarboxylase
MSDLRSRGLENIVKVYGDDLGFPERMKEMPPEQAPFTTETIDHLFAEIWDRPGLSIRDRRLLVLGLTAGLGRADLAETQIVGALRNEELSREQLGEVVLQLAFYAGWPCATAINSAVSAAVARVADEG